MIDEPIKDTKRCVICGKKLNNFNSNQGGFMLVKKEGKTYMKKYCNNCSRKEINRFLNKAS